MYVERECEEKVSRPSVVVICESAMREWSSEG